MNGSSRAKRCATCGRRFDWRPRWRDTWESVRYCGERCRRSKPGALDHELERVILELLAERRRGATICPSEAARAVRSEGWRELMDRTRWAAGRLIALGRVEVLQRGRLVEIESARGPIRLRAVGGPRRSPPRRGARA